jgi:hypothetical protein
LEGREEQPSFAIIDSQSVKTGPDARLDIGYDAGKKINGRKRHILVDTLGMLLKAGVHRRVFRIATVQPSFSTTRQPFSLYRENLRRWRLSESEGQEASPRPMEIVKRNQTGIQVLPKCWIVERTLAWLGINRRLANDFERFSVTSLAFIQTAMIKLMTRRLARYPLS